MTNGEKLKETFPNMRITVCEFYVQVIGEKYEFNNTYPLDWWNAEYKEPTTKNDLGVDAVSRQAVLELIADYDLSMGQVVKGIHALPSVTPQEPRKGHWIKTPKAVMGEGYMWYCNKCEHQVYQDSSRPYPSENYCPNCGADMREVDNRNDD